MYDVQIQYEYRICIYREYKCILKCCRSTGSTCFNSKRTKTYTRLINAASVDVTTKSNMAPIERSAVAIATPEVIWKACFEHMKFELWDPDVTEVGVVLR